MNYRRLTLRPYTIFYLPAGPPAEPSPRWSQFSASAKGKLYVWGGFTERRAELLHTFDPVLETWSEKECTGPSHPGLYHGACASARHHLYLYGGTDGINRQSSLSQLDINSGTWEKLSESSGPMKKSGCEMITYDNKLVVFGGIGVPSSSIQQGLGKLQLTNELHTFDLQKSELYNYI